MGVGPDGACGGSNGGGDSCAHNTAAATRVSASEAGARTLMAAGWYHAAESRRVRRYDALSTCRKQNVEYARRHVSGRIYYGKTANCSVACDVRKTTSQSGFRGVREPKVPH
jgi:hypothetical protein